MAIVPFEDATRRGKVGQQANAEEWNAITRLASGTDTAPIGMGQPVQRVAGSDMQIEAWDGESEVLGVTVYHVACDDVEGFPEGFNTPVMTAGVLYVAAGGAATAGSPAFYDEATDRWSDATGVAVPGAEFDTTAAAEEIVKIRYQRASAAAAVAP